MSTNMNTPGFNLTIKGFLTAGLILAMMIPALYVQNLVEERKQRQEEVIDEVSSKWAHRQVLAGPYLTVPYSYREQINEKQTSTITKHLIILPEQLHVKGEVTPHIKKRSIYEVALYKSDMQLTGHFLLNNVQAASGETIHWDRATLCIGVSDTRGIESQPAGSFMNKPVTFEAGLPTRIAASRGANAAVDLSGLIGNEALPFSIPLQLRGSESLQVLPMGKSTTVALQSTWPAPSFTGKFLPQHQTDDTGFSASWSVLHFNRDFPQIWKDNHYEAGEFAFGLSLLQPTDNYAKTMRSVKYAILFIGLTFAFFFLLEIIYGHRVHPVQYILTGIALVVFYTLLLSISEVISFNKSYAIAAFATTMLITLYGKHLFHRWRNAAIIGGFLGGLYAFIYVLIQLEDTSLLAGSIGLFVLVALAMHLSRRIKWYAPQPEPVPVTVHAEASTQS